MQQGSWPATSPDRHDQRVGDELRRRGKAVCGCCDKPLASVGRDYLACRVAMADGPCPNRSRVRRSRLESEVLEALGSQLMQPARVAKFVAEFTSEWNRLSAEISAGAAVKRRELEAVQRKLAGLIEAIADGLRAPGLQGRLDELETRRRVLEAEIATAGASKAPRLHPNLAEVYRDKILRLRNALSNPVGGVEVLEGARALIERVEVYPPAESGAAPRIELVGHLTSMLRLAGVFGSGNGKSPLAAANGLDVLLSSVKVDAGTGFEPVTFRL